MDNNTQNIFEQGEQSPGPSYNTAQTLVKRDSSETMKGDEQNNFRQEEQSPGASYATAQTHVRLESSDEMERTDITGNSPPHAAITTKTVDDSLAGEDIHCMCFPGSRPAAGETIVLCSLCGKWFHHACYMEVTGGFTAFQHVDGYCCMFCFIATVEDLEREAAPPPLQPLTHTGEQRQEGNTGAPDSADELPRLPAYMYYPLFLADAQVQAMVQSPLSEGNIDRNVQQLLAKAGALWNHNSGDPVLVTEAKRIIHVAQNQLHLIGADLTPAQRRGLFEAGCSALRCLATSSCRWTLGYGKTRLGLPDLRAIERRYMFGGYPNAGPDLSSVQLRRLAVLQDTLGSLRGLLDDGSKWNERMRGASYLLGYSMPFRSKYQPPGATAPEQLPFVKGHLTDEWRYAMFEYGYCGLLVLAKWLSKRAGGQAVELFGRCVPIEAFELRGQGS